MLILLDVIAELRISSCTSSSSNSLWFRIPRIRSIHYLGQYLSTKSIYGEFLKAPNKKIFHQSHSDELAQYEEALQILKQHSPDGKLPTMKDLRAEKEQLTIQKDAQYDTYLYFKDYHKELQTVCANVDSILGTEREMQQHEQRRTRKHEPSL